MVITELGVFSIEPDGMSVVELAPGVTARRGEEQDRSDRRHRPAGRLIQDPTGGSPVRPPISRARRFFACRGDTSASAVLRARIAGGETLTEWLIPAASPRQHPSPAGTARASRGSRATLGALGRRLRSSAVPGWHQRPGFRAQPRELREGRRDPRVRGADFQCPDTHRSGGKRAARVPSDPRRKLSHALHAGRRPLAESAR